MICGQNRA